MVFIVEEVEVGELVRLRGLEKKNWSGFMKWVLAELSLLKWVVLGVKVCRKGVDFEVRCKVWFS